MPGNTTFSDTEKLIRCTVINRYQEQSVRLVELENFRLWEYLMTHKHGASIHDLEICLWVFEEEFLKNENIYSRAGETEAVDCIIIDLYDDEYGFSNIIKRFARASETDKIVDILTSHLPDYRKSSAECQPQIYKGYSIIQRQHVDKRPMLTGLDTA